MKQHISQRRKLQVLFFLWRDRDNSNRHRLKEIILSTKLEYKKNDKWNVWIYKIKNKLIKNWR